MAESKKKAVDANMLEKSLVITRPVYTYALIAFIIMALGSLLWTLFGSIPQRIEGLGEINTQGGLNLVTTAYQGQVQKVKVHLYQKVKKGDVLIILKQPELENQLVELSTSLHLLKEKDSLLIHGDVQSSTLRSGINVLEIQKLREQRDESEKTVKYLQEKITQDYQLYQSGLITYSQYFTTLTSLSQARADVIALKSQLSAISLSSQEWKLGKVMNEKEVRNDIKKLETQLANLNNEYKLNTEITAPESGVVVQVSAKYGDIVSPGENLATIERPGNHNNYIVDLFVPFQSNAEIDSGMFVQVEPFTVNYNLYGWMKGTVIEVEHFVSTSTSLNSTLNNNSLAGLIESKGPVYKVTVKLETDSTSFSGFAWSHQGGPPYKVSVGTLCKGYVRVRSKAPIDYLIPIFKEYFN